MGVSVSDDFAVWNTTRRLIVAPDESDGTAAENSEVGMGVSTELHNGPTYYHAAAGVYMMLLERCRWGAAAYGACDLPQGRLAEVRPPFQKVVGATVLPRR